MKNNTEINKFIENGTFLVTGGAGFIGSNIVEYLFKHNAKKIFILDDLSTGNIKNIENFIKNNNKVEFVKASICDFNICNKLIKETDYIFHEAALGSVQRSIENPLETNKVNITGFLNILYASKNNRIKRIVFASSSSVYGDIDSSKNVENKTGNVLSPYAVTKVSNELYAKVFSKIYGLDAVALRYFNVFGPKQNPKGPYAAVIPLFINSLLSDRKVKIYGNGKQTRDFTYVDNVVQANIKIMMCNKNIAGEVFNVAVGKSTSVNEILNKISNILQIKPSIRYLPPRKGELQNSLADISKIKKIIDYTPETNINKGLTKTIEWFKKLRKVESIK